MPFRNYLADGSISNFGEIYPAFEYDQCPIPPHLPIRQREMVNPVSSYLIVAQEYVSCKSLENGHVSKLLIEQVAPAHKILKAPNLQPEDPGSLLLL